MKLSAAALLYECRVSKMEVNHILHPGPQASMSSTDDRAKLKGTGTLLFGKDVNGFCHQVAIFTYQENVPRPFLHIHNLTSPIHAKIRR